MMDLLGAYVSSSELHYLLKYGFINLHIAFVKEDCGNE